MRILVVDDEKTLVKGMKFNLENEGYEVECAYDGAAALGLAREYFICLETHQKACFQTIQSSKLINYSLTITDTPSGITVTL